MPAITLPIAANIRRERREQKTRHLVSADGTFQLPTSAPGEINSKFHVHKAGPATPYDGIAGRRVALASE
ncbi:hypothetical protein, partial [Novosphingobium guangzhouense]|uniref:hypothetical protein n=1 Tax=Novosphingobium guangzhouense TaxID=1850347 RepID=UPI001B8076BA